MMRIIVFALWLVAGAAVQEFDQGILAAGRGDYAGAIERFTRALDSSELTAAQRGIVYANRGSAYDELGDFALAVADFNRVIELRPEDPDGYLNRGVTFGKLGLPARAVADFDRAIALRPDLVEAYNNRGIALARQGLFDRAIADLDQAIRLAPDDAFSYFNRGLLYEDNGLRSRAIRDFKAAYGLAPEQPILQQKMRSLGLLE